MTNEVNFDDFIDDVIEQEEVSTTEENDFDDLSSPEETETEQEEPKSVETDGTWSSSDMEESSDDDADIDKKSSQYFKFLKDADLLRIDESFNFDGSIDGLQKALDITKENLKYEAELEFIENLPEEFKYALEHTRKGGSLMDFVSTMGEVDYSNLDFDDVDTQRSVMRDYYKTTSNYNDAKIEKLIHLLESQGDLQNEAIDSANELIGMQQEYKLNFIEKQKEEEQRKKEEVQKQTNLLLSAVDGVSTMDIKRKNRIKAFMLAPVAPNDSTTQFAHTLSSVFSNTNHLIELADLLADYNPKVGFNYDRLKAKLKTETNKSLKDILQASSKGRITGSSSKTKPNSEDFNWNAFLSN
jgi:hypothetical protein